MGPRRSGSGDSVLLDTIDRRAIYLAEGLGHAVCSLQDDSTVMYLCSATYEPGREHAINPLDPELGLAVPEGVTPVLSARDTAAPSMSEAAAKQLLPRYDECLRLYADLASRA